MTQSEKKVVAKLRFFCGRQKYFHGRLFRLIHLCCWMVTQKDGEFQVVRNAFKTNVFCRGMRFFDGFLEGQSRRQERTIHSCETDRTVARKEESEINHCPPSESRHHLPGSCLQR